MLFGSVIQIIHPSLKMGKLSKNAYESMQPYLLEEYSNPSQPYSFSRTTKKALKEARETIAKCIGAFPEEIFFTSGGTESDNWVIKSIGIFNRNPGAILTSAIEHHAILRSCNAVEEFGHPVAYMWPTEFGEITPSILRSLRFRRSRRRHDHRGRSNRAA